MRALKCVFFAVVLFGFVVWLGACGDSGSSGGFAGTPPSGGPGGTPTGGGSGGTPPGGGSGGGGGSVGNASVAHVFVASGRTAPAVASGQIVGFNVASDGSTTPVQGSPFTGANGSLVTNGKFLVATDGTNIVSSAIGTDGVITQVSTVSGVAHNDTPSDSAVGSLSIDRSGSTIYAGERNFQGADNNAFAFFNLASNGSLTFIANSGINANYGGNLTFTSDNKFAYGQGCFFLGWNLFGLIRNSDGTLTPFDDKAPSPPIQDNLFYCPGASTVSPTSSQLAGVILPESQPGVNNKLSVYQINSDGTLTLVPNSIMATSFAAINDIKFDPSGGFVAAATNAGVQMYRLTSGTLVAVGAPQDANTSFDAVQWDNSGHLYAISNSAQKLFVYSANQGTLSAAPGSPYSVTNPVGLAVATTM